MKRTLGTLAILALAIRAALAATPAELNLVAFEDTTPLAQAIVEVDGDDVGATNADGSAQLRLQPGKRTIVLKRDGQELLRYEIEVADGETAELIATLRAGQPPQIAVESSIGDGADRGSANTAPAAADAGPPGILRGRIVSSENGAPVANARIFVAGTPLDLRTNANGEFVASVPAGAYAISVIAADFSAQTIDGLTVVAEQETIRDVELTPAGLMLPEFVVLEPYIAGSLASFVEERRESFAVAEVLGIEQISRAGDSDVAGALRRVTGLTLVDGKYIYVRGLGERYSSVLLNGAPVPSPDPSRRVVPLDLFPVEILSGVVIQKTFSAEMPGEFGGGTIQLRTRTMPEDFFIKLQVGQGWVDGATFEDGLSYRGGTQDWNGFDAVRGLPDSIIDANQRFGRLQVQTPFSEGLTQEELQTTGRDLASQGYDVTSRDLGTNGTFSFGIGDSFDVGDDWRVGYLNSVRYSQGWDNLEEVRRVFSFVGEGEPLAPLSDIVRTKTERAIDLSAFLAMGVEFGENHKLTSTSTMVRQTIDSTRIDEGFDISSSISRIYLLEWEENALIAQQFNGEHAFPDWMDFSLDWNYTRARATRESPNTRNYRYDRLGATDDTFTFTGRSDSNATTFSELTDNSKSYNLNLQLPITLSESHSLTVLAGLAQLDRDRDSGVRRYSVIGNLPANLQGLLTGPLDLIFAPENFTPDIFQLREVSRNSDAYTAVQEIDAYYLSLDWLWTDVLRLTIGARDETNFQEVRTFNLIDPNSVDSEASIDTSDLLPSVSGLWFINEDSQLRLIYAETVSRPDFRELSTAPFNDPLIDTISVGNPDLVPASITNYDIRYEYYFSATEIFSVALFAKDFVTPIERIQSPATGDVVTYTNVPAATLYGIEFDVYKSLDFVDAWSWADRLGAVPWESIFVGANYAYIESDVELTRDTAGISTNLERPLQGQSPYVVNVQIGWQPEDGRSEATLLYNVAGRRISEVGVFGIPDVYEEPAGQLDFVFATSLWSEAWKLKLRMRNLLDPKVEFTVGDEIQREYKRGREVFLSLEWSP